MSMKETYMVEVTSYEEQIEINGQVKSVWGYTGKLVPAEVYDVQFSESGFMSMLGVREE